MQGEKLSQKDPLNQPAQERKFSLKAENNVPVCPVSGPESRPSLHPWRTLLIILALQGGLVYLFGFSLQAILKKPFDMSKPTSLTVVLAFTLSEILAYLFAPYLLNVPVARRSFREYLTDIRLNRFRPFWKLLTLTITCLIVLILCQGGGSVIYQLTLGRPVTSGFLSEVFDLGQVLPPRSFLILAFLYTMLEEVVFRGVLLQMLLRRHPVRRAILYSALAFGLAHLPAAIAGRSLVSTGGQVVWATLFGLFYATLVIETDSLVPAMSIHWLINVFQNSLTASWQSMPAGLRALYGIVFGYGLAALVLIPWIRFFARKWLPPRRTEQLME